MCLARLGTCSMHCKEVKRIRFEECLEGVFAIGQQIDNLQARYWRWWKDNGCLHMRPNVMWTNRPILRRTA